MNVGHVSLDQSQRSSGKTAIIDALLVVVIVVVALVLGGYFFVEAGRVGRGEAGFEKEFPEYVTARSC